MSTYEPGTVAVATVRGVPNVRVVWRKAESGYLQGWWASSGPVFVEPKDVTDVRVLPVLDLEDPTSHVKALREYAPADSWGCLSWLADQIEEQTKPPRIPEPGLYGVVRSWDGQRFMRTSQTAKRGWRYIGDSGNTVAWGEIDDPTLVRPGIEEAS